MKTVISASRRTDLPRWHLDKVMSWVDEGRVRVLNPFNRVPYEVSLDPANVHCIVWWSKDYSVYLRHAGAFDAYHQFFHFTINGYTDGAVARALEPGVTASLDARLDQLAQLVEASSPAAVNWRFDPVVFWKEENEIKDNTGDFISILDHVASTGITTATVSFATWYGKSSRRAKKRRFPFVVPPPRERLAVAERLAREARARGVALHACCCDDLVAAGLMGKASCIDGARLSALFHEPASVARDTGQRTSCGCTRSKDIGSYELKCGHGCVYCYASPW